MKLPKSIICLSTALLLSSINAYSHEGHKHAPTVNVPAEDINLSTSWNGKKVAFLGDSMTDPKTNPPKNIIGNILKP